MKKRELYWLLRLLVFVCWIGSGSSFAQTISTGSVSTNSFCGGDAVSVPFSFTGIFTGSTVFQAQLSDASGSFSAPTVIGTLTNTFTSSIVTSAIGSNIPLSTPAGTAYRVRVVSNSPAVTGSTGAVVMTINPRPAQPSAGIASPTSSPICSGQTVSLTAASGTSGSSIRWYSGSTLVGSGPSYPTQTAGTYTAQAVVGSCVSLINTQVNVNITTTPATPTVASQTVCQGSGDQLLSPNGSQYKWYDGNNNLLPNNGAAPTVSAGSAGTSTYKVEQNNNGCVSGRATMTYTVLESPGQLAPVSIAYCETNRPSSLSVNSSAVIRWYIDPDGSIQIPTPTPPNIARSAPYNYYIRQVGANGCLGAPSLYAIRVNGSPVAPSVTSSTQYCQNVPAQQLTASGQNLTWYDASNNVLTAAPTPPTATTGTITYYVTQTTGDGCTSGKATININISPVPAAPTAAGVSPYCQGVTAAVLSATGQNLRWYGTDATGGTSSSVAPRPGTGTPGTSNYYVTQTVSGCESTRLAIPVTVKTTPGVPGTAETTFCQNYTAPTLTATPVTNATINWYGSSSGGTASANAPVPPNNVGNVTYTYYVSQTLDGCESARGTLSVRVKPTPGAPGVTAVNICNNAPSQPLIASGTNLRWFDPNGNSITGSPAPPTNNVGTFNYQVSQSLDGCESPRSTLPVTIIALPPAPNVSNVAYCQIQQDQPAQSVSPVNATGANLRWYNVDGNQFPSAPTPPINQATVINYQVTQTVNNCESSKATLQVTVQSTPVPGTPIPTVTYCRNDVAVPLTAVAATGASLRWIDPNGTLSNEAPTPFTLNATPAGGRLFYVYQVGQNGCASARASIKLIVNTNPTLSLLGSTTVNLGISAPLQLKFTGAPPFSYTLSDGTFGVAQDTLSTVNVTPAQTTIFQVASVSNVCGSGLPGNPATATVTVKIPTITTSGLTTTTLCAGLSFSVPFTTSGEFNAGNAFKVQLADTTSKKFVDISAATTIGPIVATVPASQAGGVYFVRVIGTNPSIPVLGQNSPTVLYVRPYPTAVMAGPASVYEGSPGSLSITFTGDGPWTFVYNDSLRNQTIQTNANPHRLDIRPLKTTTYRLLSVSNNCGTGTVSGTAITVQVLPLLGVEDDLLGTSVKAYPVPTAAGLTIDIDVALQKNPAVIELTDLTGRTAVQHTTRNRQTQLDLSSQPTGMYILKIQVGDRKTFRRILKQ